MSGGGPPPPRPSSDRRSAFPVGSPRDRRPGRDDDQTEAVVNHEHAQFLVENLRKIYEDENCLLSDITLVATDGEVGDDKSEIILFLEQKKIFFKKNLKTTRCRLTS